MSNSLIEVNNLKKTFGGLTAVNIKQLGFNKGQLTSIIGPNGAGKTTFFDLISRFQSQDSGQILFEGKNIEKNSPRQRRREGLAHIPEDRSNTGLNVRLAIWENLIGTSYFRSPLSRGGIVSMKNILRHSNELRETFDIRSPGVTIRAGSLSGGNQQKVVVARELSEEPALTIASQPTRGVDIGNIEAIHEQIVEIRDSGKAVLLISAELDEVMSVADRVGVIYEGEFVEWVDPSKVNQEQMGLYMAGIKG